MKRAQASIVIVSPNHGFYSSCFVVTFPNSSSIVFALFVCFLFFLFVIILYMVLIIQHTISNIYPQLRNYYIAAFNDAFM